jgi:hypothetical protein
MYGGTKTLLKRVKNARIGQKYRVTHGAPKSTFKHQWVTDPKTPILDLRIVRRETSPSPLMSRDAKRRSAGFVIEAITPDPKALRPNTYKVCRKGSGIALAWVIGLGSGQWLARCDDQACGPTTLNKAKAAARNMAAGAWGEYYISDPVADLNGLQASLDEPEPGLTAYQLPAKPKGFRVRLCIEDEKELQVLGCGWRVVTVEFDGPRIHLHHNGNTATIKRPAFKALIAANKRLRRKRPVLRLVVSNPPPVAVNSEAA